MRRRFKNIDLNRKADKIYGDPLICLIRKYSSYIVDLGFPINEIYWNSFLIRDRSISFDKFRYVEYEDPINISTRPFRKD